MGPAALANRLIGVVATHDRLRRNEPLALPIGEPFAQQFEHLGFSGQIGIIGRGVTAFALSIDPADAVEPFLKHIARARHDIVIGPAAKTFRAAQGFHRPRAIRIKGIDHPTIHHRRALLLLIEFQFGID